MSNQLIENSHFEIKVSIRKEFLPDKKCLKVLDVYSADGSIWERIKFDCPKIDFRIVRLEKRKNSKGIYLQGDNRKFLRRLPIESFDVIDFDSYGCCYPALSLIHDRIIPDTVCFFTQISIGMGGLPFKMLKMLGYSGNMVKKCPTLFSKNPIEKFLNYCGTVGYKRAIIYKGKGIEARKGYIVGFKKGG